MRRTEEELANGVTGRMLRQRRLTSTEDPLELVAVVDETVLHRPVGGPEVLRVQLRHLVEAATLDTVTLHVLPTAIGTCRAGLRVQCAELRRSRGAGHRVRRARARRPDNGQGS